MAGPYGSMSVSADARRRVRVILGSRSGWRRKILRDALGDIETMSADIDEKAIRHPDAAVMVELIARAKADALLPHITGRALLVTSDQVVTFQGEVREKPEDVDQAFQWLIEYRDRALKTVTGVVVTDTENGRIRAGVHVCTVSIGAIPYVAMKEAIGRGSLLSCCGGLAGDDPALAPYVQLITGDGDERERKTSVDGIPIGMTLRFLKELGLEGSDP